MTIDKNLYIGSQTPDEVQGTTLPETASTIPGSASTVTKDSTASAEGSSQIPSFGNTPVLVIPRKGDPWAATSFDINDLATGDVFLSEGVSGPIKSALSGIDMTEIKNYQNAPLDGLKALFATPDAAVNKTLFNLASSSVEQQKEFIANLSQLINASMQEGPPKRAYLNFLKHVGELLNKMSAMLYELQMVNSESSRDSMLAKMDAIKAQHDTALKNLQVQKEAAEKRAEAGKKTAWDWIGMGFSILFQLIAAAALTVFVPVAGAIAAAVILINIVDTIMKAAGSTTAVWGAMFNAINEGIKDPVLKQIITIAITAALLSVLTLSGSILVGGGDAFTDILMASNLVPEDQRSKVMLALTITFTVMSVVAMVAMLLIPGAQAAIVARLTDSLAKVVSMAGKVSKVIAKVVDVVGKTMLKVIDASSSSKALHLIERAATGVVTAVQTVGTITTTIRKATLYNALSELSLQMGKFQSEIEEIKALIKVLQKIIAALGEENADISKLIGIIQQTQVNKYKDASYQLDQLYAG